MQMEFYITQVWELNHDYLWQVKIQITALKHYKQRQKTKEEIREIFAKYTMDKEVI